MPEPPEKLLAARISEDVLARVSSDLTLSCDENVPMEPYRDSIALLLSETNHWLVPRNLTDAQAELVAEVLFQSRTCLTANELDNARATWVRLLQEVLGVEW